MAPALPPSLSIDVLRDFVAHEAALLDARKYEAWLALFATDGRYWLPIDPAATQPSLQLNLIYDEHDRLADRIARLTSGRMHAEQPASRVARVLSGTHVLSAMAHEVLVRSTFLLAARRVGVTRVLAGHVQHRLRVRGSMLSIIEKRVDLIDSEDALEDLSFLP